MVEIKKTLTFSQLRVGIFVLFGLAVLAFLIMNSSGDFNPFEKKMRLKARFAAADGLREGSEVLLAGVHIGKVEEVTLLPPDSPEDFKIEAVMAVQNELNGKPISERIRTDSNGTAGRDFPACKRQDHQHLARDVERLYRSRKTTCSNRKRPCRSTS